MRHLGAARKCDTLTASLGDPDHRPRSPMNDTIQIRAARWQRPEDHDALLDLRMTVFVHEQGVPAEMEVDELDAPSRHYLAVSPADDTPGETRAVGCVRLTPTGKITRLCVAKDARGQGIGSALLRRAIDEAKAAQMSRIYLHAQTHAGAFYERHGFRATGDSFIEAGIPHQKMVLQ